MKTTGARQSVVSRLISCLVVFPVAYLMTSLEAVYASGSPESETAVESFLLKEQALWQQRRQGQLAAGDWDMKYIHLIESEADQLKGLMPGILQVSGEHLGYQSDEDRRLEELLKLNHPTGEEAAELQSLLQE